MHLHDIHCSKFLVKFYQPTLSSNMNKPQQILQFHIIFLQKFWNFNNASYSEVGGPIDQLTPKTNSWGLWQAKQASFLPVNIQVIYIREVQNMWNRLFWDSLTVSNSFKPVSSQHSAQSVVRPSMAFSYCIETKWIHFWPLENGNYWVYLCVPHYLTESLNWKHPFFHSKGTWHKIKRTNWYQLVVLIHIGTTLGVHLTLWHCLPNRCLWEIKHRFEIIVSSQVRKAFPYWSGSAIYEW